jgi:TIR domain
MSKIFISYAHDDRAIAQKLAEVLGAEDWDVFWDRDIRTGKDWREVLDDELAAAQCVVVLWSKSSVKSRHVIDEATIGIDRKVLFPLFIEGDVLPPIGFRGVQAANFTSWEGSANDPAIRELIDDIAKSLPEKAQKENEAKRIKQILSARRQFRNRYTLLTLAIGGAVGAGFAVFLLRTILGWMVLNLRIPAVSAATPFGIYGGLLGAGLSLGIALGDQVWKSGNAPDANHFSWIRIFRRRGIVVIILGALSFAVTHTALAVINSSDPLSAEILNSTWASLLAGAALSITLYDQPYMGWHLSAGGWLWRLVLVTITFTLVHWPFAFRRVPGIGLVLAGTVTYYRYNFKFWRFIPWPQDVASAYLALIDAALLGAVLLFGVTVGIVKGADIFARSLKAIDVDEK